MNSTRCAPSIILVSKIRVLHQRLAALRGDSRGERRDSTTPIWRRRKYLSEASSGREACEPGHGPYWRQRTGREEYRDRGPVTRNPACVRSITSKSRAIRGPPLHVSPRRPNGQRVAAADLGRNNDSTGGGRSIAGR